MEHSQKIVIPTTVTPEEDLPTPHFDAQAELTAQPVVPLREVSARNALAALSRSSTAFLVLIIIAAVSVGVAGGLLISLYQSTRRSEVPVASQPSPAGTMAVDPEPAPSPAEQISRMEPPTVTAAIKTDEPVEPPVPVQPRGTAETKKASDPSAREKESKDRNKELKDNTRGAPPPAAREKPQQKPREIAREVNDREQKREERAERRRQQRERRVEEETGDDAPRQSESAGREINRIRQIFEGIQRQP